jgi:probable rRNA maturation factor
MTIDLDVQFVSKNSDIPKEAEFQYWVNAVPSVEKTSACLRIVDEPEAKSLNKEYRHIDKATNVLSFPAELPLQLNIKFLGDIVICASVVGREAQEQGKQLSEHWAHLLVHGILHLQGYDHQDDADADEMESLEIGILQKLNITNPYEPNLVSKSHK